MHLKTFQYNGFIYSYLYQNGVAKHQVMKASESATLTNIRWDSNKPMSELTFSRWVRLGMPPAYSAADINSHFANNTPG
jgi:hypothetical protein